MKQVRNRTRRMFDDEFTTLLMKKSGYIHAIRLIPGLIAKNQASGSTAVLVTKRATRHLHRETGDVNSK